MDQGACNKIKHIKELDSLRSKISWIHLPVAVANICAFKELLRVPTEYLVECSFCTCLTEHDIYKAAQHTI